MLPGVVGGGEMGMVDGTAACRHCLECLPDSRRGPPAYAVVPGKVAREPEADLVL